MWADVKKEVAKRNTTFWLSDIERLWTKKLTVSNKDKISRDIDEVLAARLL
jgi:hypothetical protein